MDHSFYICVENQDCPDLEIRKVYHGIVDLMANQHGQIRIIDESGEDYLYPSDYFVAEPTKERKIAMGKVIVKVKIIGIAFL